MVFHCFCTEWHLPYGGRVSKLAMALARDISCWCKERGPYQVWKTFAMRIKPWYPPGSGGHGTGPFEWFGKIGL